MRIFILDKKEKKKKKDNTDIQHKKNENLKGKTISKSKAININEFKNISDFGTTQETSNQKDKTVTNENDWFKDIKLFINLIS